MQNIKASLISLTAKKLPQDVNPRGVFACNELDLSEVSVYGFDYDYTLAHYKPTMEHLLYNLGREYLLEKYNVSIKPKNYDFVEKMEFVEVLSIVNRNIILHNKPSEVIQ